MRLIDEIYLELPFYDSRRIPDELATSVSGSTGSNASDSFAQWASMQSTRKPEPWYGNRYMLFTLIHCSAW